jgi:hypothetical protein
MLQKEAKTELDAVEVRDDAQNRFERAVDIALRHPPIQRIKPRVIRRRNGANKRRAKAAS